MGRSLGPGRRRRIGESPWRVQSRCLWQGVGGGGPGRGRPAEGEPMGERAGVPELQPEHHRDIQGGTARAAVFGVSDGLLTNVSLILGVAGASPTSGLVRLAGMAGLVAGAPPMAAGADTS